MYIQLIGSLAINGIAFSKPSLQAYIHHQTSCATNHNLIGRIALKAGIAFSCCTAFPWAAAAITGLSFSPVLALCSTIALTVILCGYRPPKKYVAAAVLSLSTDPKLFVEHLIVGIGRHIIHLLKVTFIPARPSEIVGHIDFTMTPPSDLELAWEATKSFFSPSKTQERPLLNHQMSYL